MKNISYFPKDVTFILKTILKDSTNYNIESITTIDDPDIAENTDETFYYIVDTFDEELSPS